MLIKPWRVNCRISVGSQLPVQTDKQKQRYDCYAGCPALLIRLKRDTHWQGPIKLCVHAVVCVLAVVLVCSTEVCVLIRLPVEGKTSQWPD